MAYPLAQPYDVETALLRPLTALESTYIDSLIVQASALWRQAMPSVDERVAGWALDPKPSDAVDPAVVAAAVAGVIKRYLTNVEGASSKSDTVGPYGHTVAFKSGDTSKNGSLVVTAADLAKVNGPASFWSRPRTIRTPVPDFCSADRWDC